MSKHPKDPTKLKAWEVALSDAIARDPTPWNDYDTQIQLVVTAYSTYLKSVAGYIAPDWQKIKAITWVETGANSSAWKSAPMQIGVNGDPGLRELLTKPAGKLILPPEYVRVLTVSNVPANGNLNIEAGVGYLLKILATFALVRNPVPPPPVAPASAATPASAASAAAPASAASAVAPASAASAIPTAKEHAKGKKQSHKSPHHPAKAAPTTHLAITGWRQFDLDYVGQHYNAGDGNYADKLRFALDIIQGRITPELAPKPVKKPEHKAKHPPLRLPPAHHHAHHHR